MLLESTKKVAIIIVNWNGSRFLKDCLEAVYSQTYTNFDVYFVDNGSEDNSVYFVKKIFSKVKIIELKHNTGFAKGNNVAIKEALKDKNIKYLVFLNNDTIVDKDWLKKLVEITEKGKQIGMVSSKSLFPNGKIQTIGLSLEKYLQGSGDGGNSIGFNQDPEKFNREKEVFVPCGVSALYRREVLEEIGDFDEDFFCYGEDLDLGFRARLAGWKCIFAPDSKLTHFHSQSGGASSPFKAFYTRRNGYYIAIKCFGLFDLLLYPGRDLYWNIRQVFLKNKLKSVEKLKTEIGLMGMTIIVSKAYFSTIKNLCKMLKKRQHIKKTTSITRKEYESWFDKSS